MSSANIVQRSLGVLLRPIPDVVVMWASIVWLAGHMCVAQGQNMDAISMTALGPNKLRIRIDRPDVTKPTKLYPTVQFQSGDVVVISGGGCVQTGGSGETWKRYVDPSGTNADKLYSGLVNIPGTTQGVQRLQLWSVGQAQNRSISIRQPAFLQLGYQDDDYRTNGYWGHDDGTENQCKGVGPAWIEFMVQRGSSVGALDGPRYNEVWQKSVHNSFEDKPSLQTQLVVGKVRSLELDIHIGKGSSKVYPGDWRVYHNYPVYPNSSCDPFSACLDQLWAWHIAHPNHEVVTLFIDVKDNWSAGHMPADLDALLRSRFPKRLFTPANLLDERCSGATTARTAVRTCGWPKLVDMKGRFVVALTNGDDSVLEGYAPNPLQSMRRAAFIAPEIDSARYLNECKQTGRSICASTTAVFYNLNSDNFIVGRDVYANRFVSRAYYKNGLIIHGINDPSNWAVAINNHIHHIATDQVDFTSAPWTITFNANGWPFGCLLQDCSKQVEQLVPVKAYVALQTVNGHTLTIVNGGGLGGPNTGTSAVAMHTDATVAGPWETFTVEWIDESHIALRTISGNYVTAVNGGGIGGPNDSRSPIHTDATWIGSWETLRWNYDAATHKVTIQTPNGRYLTAVNGGGFGGPNTTPIHTNAKSRGPWETFKIINIP